MGARSACAGGDGLAPSAPRDANNCVKPSGALSGTGLGLADTGETGPPPGAKLCVCAPPEWKLPLGSARNSSVKPLDSEDAGALGSSSRMGRPRGGAEGRGC